MRTLVRLALGAISWRPRPARARPGSVVVPDASPKASISQTIGLTDITISYHRPAVNQRKIWGGLVPYNETWRAGANENTTITFSTPATVGGQLPAAPGLHMLPGEKDWSVMLELGLHRVGKLQLRRQGRRRPLPGHADGDHGLRGAARVPLRGPDRQRGERRAALGEASGLLPITVDSKAVVIDSLNKQLRRAPRFGWQGWNQAAQWAVNHDADLDQAMAWSDHSMSLATNFTNLRTRAQIVEEGRHEDGRRAARPRAEDRERERDEPVRLSAAGEKKQDEAIAIFRKNVGITRSPGTRTTAWARPSRRRATRRARSRTTPRRCR
jgi:hypothetical protein